MKSQTHFSALVLSVLFAINYMHTTQAASQIIPFRMAGKLIIVQAKVDGQAGNFILDTRIPNVILNTRYFTGKPTDKVLVGLNGQQERVSVSYSKVEIQTQTWANVEADLISIVRLEDATGIAIHGLLGSGLFRNFSMIVDYENLIIELFSADHKRASTVFDNIHPTTGVLPFSFNGGSPPVTAQIGRKEVQPDLDANAGMKLMEDIYKAYLTADRDHLRSKNVESKGWVKIGGSKGSGDG